MKINETENRQESVNTPDQVGSSKASQGEHLTIAKVVFLNTVGCPSCRPTISVINVNEGVRQE